MHHALHKQLPTLYGIEKNGKIKTWNANIYLKGKNPATDPAFATIEHGQKDGKKQTTVRDYTEGKNIGKKNETTPLEQCIAETTRKWLDKKEKESYQETMPMTTTPSEATDLSDTTTIHEQTAAQNAAPIDPGDVSDDNLMLDDKVASESENLFEANGAETSGRR